MMADERQILETIAERIKRQMEEEIERTLFGGATTNTVAEAEDSTLTAAKLQRMVEEWDKLIRASRREQITVVVDMAHEGPMLGHETPNDGWRIECSWRDAQRIHEHWPLKLHKVNSPEQAEFVPLCGLLSDFTTKVLPMPPYDMPDDDETLAEAGER